MFQVIKVKGNNHYTTHIICKHGYKKSNLLIANKVVAFNVKRYWLHGCQVFVVPSIPIC